MRHKCLFIYTALFVYSICLVQNANSQTPAELINVLPEAEEKLNSVDVLGRIGVLDKLVVYKRDYDVTKTVLPFNLSADAYAFVVRKIFEKDLTQIDEKAASRAFSKIEFLLRKFKLKEFAKNLADYIPKFIPNGQTDFPRVGIQYGFLGTLKALQAAEFAPQIALLLQPSTTNLHREALSTLIELCTKEAVPALLSLLYDKNHLERYSAIQGLLKIGAKETAPHIAKLLNDENPNNRYWALDALIKLGAREQSGKFWQLVNSNQTGQTKTYAIAGLVYFGDAKAIEIAAQKLSENKEDHLLLEQMVQLNAVRIVPKLILLLENADYSRENAYKFRTDAVYALGKFNAREAAPILRKILNAHVGQLYAAGRLSAIQVLGNFGDKEAVDDLLYIFYKHLPNPPDNITNQTSDSAEAALALAKIGDKRVWKDLVNAAANPRYPYRSQIIIELNKHLNAELWQKARERKISKGGQSRQIVSLKELTEFYSRETDISVVLHFVPGKDAAKRQPLAPPYKDTNGYPWAYIQYEMSLLDGLREIPGIISDGTLPQNFTFIFDDKQIHILTVEKAVEWWKNNILNKNAGT